MFFKQSTQLDTQATLLLCQLYILRPAFKAKQFPFIRQETASKVATADLGSGTCSP